MNVIQWLPGMVSAGQPALKADSGQDRVSNALQFKKKLQILSCFNLSLIFSGYSKYNKGTQQSNNQERDRPGQGRERERKDEKI